RAATPPALVEASDRGVPSASEHEGSRDREQGSNDERSAADGRTSRGEVLGVIATVLSAAGAGAIRAGAVRVVVTGVGALAVAAVVTGVGALVVAAVVGFLILIGPI